MNPSLYPTIIIPFPLGDASNFDRSIFPLSSYRRRDTLGRGDYYLDATLEEVLKIPRIGVDPRERQKLVDDAKSRYDQLMLRKSELERRPDTKNPLKRISKYRAALLFLFASRRLYYTTKSRSDEMTRSIVRGLLSLPGEDMEPVDGEVDEMTRSIVRSLFSLPGEDMEPVDGEVPPGTELDGIAVRLEHPLDDSAKQQILDAANTIVSSSAAYEGDEKISDTTSFLSDDYYSAAGSLLSLISSDTEESPEDASSPSTNDHPESI